MSAGSVPASASLADDGLETPRRYLSIFALVCGTAAVVVDGSAPVVALPSIARALGVDEASTTLIVSLYQLIVVTTLLPFVAVGERIGCRRLYCYGLGTFALASMLFLFASTLAEYLGLRIIQALGAGATLSMMGALLRSTFPTGQIGRSIGIHGIVVGFCLAVAPSLGGFVLAVAPWPWVFAAAAPLALLALASYRALPYIQAHSVRFDWFAAALCAATLAILIGGLEFIGRADRPGLALGLGAIGATCAVFLVRHERRQERPVLPVDLLAQPALGLSALCALMVFAASMTFMVTLPFRLEAVYRFPAAEVGMVILPWPMMSMILAPLAGILSDKISAEMLGAVGMMIGAVGLVLLGTLPADNVAPWDVAWRMALAGAGFALFLPPNARLIMALTPRERAASGSSVISLSRLTGQSIGAAGASVLLGMSLGTSRFPAFAAAAIAMVAGLASPLRRRFMPRAFD